MATPAEIAAAAVCYDCIPNQQASILYLLTQISGVADPATIAVNAVCYDCIPNKQAAILYLLDQVASAPAPVSDAVTCGVGAPSAVPSSGCGVYYDTANSALYIYSGGAWQLKA